MTIPNQNFSVSRGDSAAISIALTAADGNPFDASLPGTEIKWRLTATPHASDAEALAHKELGAGISVISGGVELVLEGSDTDQEPGLFYHELKVFQAGDVATALTGWVSVRRALRMGNIVQPLSGSLRVSELAPAVT